MTALGIIWYNTERVTKMSRGSFEKRSEWVKGLTMSIFDFKRRFGQAVTIEEVKQSFLNKLRRLLLRDVETYFKEGATGLFDHVCLFLNKDSEKVIHEYNREYLYGGLADTLEIPPIEYFTKNKFGPTLLVVEALYTYFVGLGKSEWLGKVDQAVEEALEQPISLGISWREGKFYPSGAKELSERLVGDVLKWLTDFPEAKQRFSDALERYTNSDFENAIANAYSAMEGLVKELLSNDKNLEENKNEFIKKLGLPKEFSQIIHFGFLYACEFSARHGRRKVKTTKRGKPDGAITESFIYHVGLIMRIAILKKNRFKELQNS